MGPLRRIKRHRGRTRSTLGPAGGPPEEANPRPVDNRGDVDGSGSQEAAAAVFVVPEEDDVAPDEEPLDSEEDGFDSDLVSVFAGAEVVVALESRESVR